MILGSVLISRTRRASGGFETLQPLMLSLANVMIPVWRVKEAFGGPNHLALRDCFLDI